MKKPHLSIFITIACVMAGGIFGYALGRSRNSQPVQLLHGASPTQIVATQDHSADASEPVTTASAEPATQSASTFPININTASHAQLVELPGIGDVLAQRIIDYREAHGPFRTKAELTKVNGIGKKKLEAVMDLITVEDS